MQDYWNPEAALAALVWQIEAGVTEVILDDPINRFLLDEIQGGQQQEPAPAQPARQVEPPRTQGQDPILEARTRAAEARTLQELQDALLAFEGCTLKHHARNLVFADGDPAADVMAIGSLPGSDEDRTARPFSGAHGALLDKMLAAIDLSRGAPGRAGAYLTHLSPWRAAPGQPVSEQDMACLRPFLERHIELANPRIILLMGQDCRALGLPRKSLQRGTFSTCAGRPALAMSSPEQLMRNPEGKRDAWADLLSLRAWLKSE